MLLLCTGAADVAAAAAAATAEVLVESLVIAALLLLLGAAAVTVVNVIVAVPSTLSTFVSLVSSQDKKKPIVFKDDKNKNADAVEFNEDKPVVIELLDDGDDEVSSDEEEDDELVLVGTLIATTTTTTTTTALAPELSRCRGRTRQRTATRRPRQKAVTAAPDRPPKKTTPAEATSAPERSVKKTAAALAASAAPERPRTKNKAVSFGIVQVQEYSVVLGDHPCREVIGGFPLSLDWAHTAAKEYSVDALEKAKANMSSSSSLPRPDMTPADRMLRIAAVPGVGPADVQKQERTRLWKVEAEKLAARPVGSTGSHSSRHLP
jgi:hypothetical protein